jgi:hypothetical protein
VYYRNNWTANTEPYCTGITVFDVNFVPLCSVGYSRDEFVEVRLGKGERLLGISSRSQIDPNADAVNSFHDDFQFLIGFQ